LNAAIARARGEVILFTDDDVTLDPGWVNAMREFFLLNPEVAAMAGRILPLVSAGSEKLWASGAGVWRLVLPIFDLGERPRPCVDMYGANMAVRTGVLRELGGFNPELGVGAAGAGEDTEFARRIQRAGYRTAYNPAAVVYHDVPAERLTWRYLWQRGEWAGRSDYVAGIGRSPLGDCRALAEASASWVGAALLGRREKQMRSLFRIARHWGALRARTNAWWRKQPA
jgi:GT2 family glycosyltransferase